MRMKQRARRGYTLAGGDPSDAYRLGNARFSRGEAGDFRSRWELTDAIQSAIEQAGDECYLCAKMRDE